ncbi:uncharacterized protein LOC122082332 isoform X2 [Macadamia integrifolia]|uniref:uncharacterized protein LOC122082332 isoform X2 n=1 Tax=Macadamia integrifolia TaxID=60698 RepID=UPI001C4F9F34|nr:uncharacterized protein LOC122082332 isoform X2 [Macadamia integrifolia]
MGRGRKTKTFSVSEVAISGPPKANCSVSARNLRKADLGGVIFGCKNYTINECLSQKLFGLPVQHFPYVKNIVPGMVLFLFNYSDRRLHGIFEAASNGRKNINPHGWSANGKEETEYPAQVRINIRKWCQALMENQFRPIIAENYYTDNHFWFELDRAQTSELISLFDASSAGAQSAIPKKVCTGESTSFEASSAGVYSTIQKKGFSWCDVVKTLPKPDKRNRNVDSEPTYNPDEMNIYDDTWTAVPEPTYNPDKMNVYDDPWLADKMNGYDDTWPAVSEPTCNPDKMHGYDDPWPAVSEEYWGNLDQSKMEAHLDIEAVDKEEEPLVSPKTGEILTNSSDLLLTADQEMKVVIAGPMTSGMPSVEQSFQEEPLDSEENRVILVKSSYHWSDSDQSVAAGSSMTSEMPSVQKCFLEEPLVPAEKEEISVFPSDSQPVIVQVFGVTSLSLMQVLEKMQTSLLEQQKKMNALENNLSQSQVQIQQLNSRLEKLESVLDPTLKHINKSGWGWAP